MVFQLGYHHQCGPTTWDAVAIIDGFAEKIAPLSQERVRDFINRHVKTYGGWNFGLCLYMISYLMKFLDNPSDSPENDWLFDLLMNATKGTDEVVKVTREHAPYIPYQHALLETITLGALQWIAPKAMNLLGFPNKVGPLNRGM